VRGRLSYANVVATIALFVALAGGAYAASQLPKNSVGTKQLKRNAVVSSKVKNGSLQAADFAKGQLPPGPQGLRGLTGSQGPAGERGPAGPPGAVRAYALVEAGTSPKLVPSRTKGFVSVSHVRIGTYCVTPESGINADQTAPIVAPEWNTGLLELEFAQFMTNLDCAPGALEVGTYTWHSNTFTMADTVSFTVALP
jgi:hypothetical protein